ncbi:MAG: VWA domain-containing protein [Muribaculaceae bacterium]|nr:VWA domain-containing protein [Muribaculaceae bacterium]
MSFAYPYILFLLLGIPIYIGLYLFARFSRRRRLNKFGRPEVLQQMMPDVSPYKPPIKLTLQCLAFACIVIALARPWGGVKSEDTSKEGIEVVIAVDASTSMLAPSSPEPGAPDRMRMAKMMLEKLIGRLNNDRVGLIEYAGEAYTLIPVTNDYVSAKMFLNSISPDQLAEQGTNIAATIEKATMSFSESKDIGKSIILITDAEELENPDGVMDAVAAAAKKNIQVNVIGVGSQTGVNIPQRGGLMIDPATGEPVVTRLNEDLAIKIAEAGKGIYVNAANKDCLNELEKQMDKVAKTALEGSMSVVHDELFALFGWLAFAFIIIDMFVVDSKITWLDKFTFFRKEANK